MANIHVLQDGEITIIKINRPEHRNAVDGPTAQALYDAFCAFDEDEHAKVAILCGEGGTFCAGADLKAIGSERMNPLTEDGIGPMGPTRMQTQKPVIAAVDGYAVAGGLELAIWCDLRVVEEDAIFGVFCRRFGVPLIDGGTVRLPRLIGQSRAMDMILTGRPVDAQEALAIGLANRVVPKGEALRSAVTLAKDIASKPVLCMRNDRTSVLEQWTLPDALKNEFRLGRQTLNSGESHSGAERFASGSGRHGQQ